MFIQNISNTENIETHHLIVTKADRGNTLLIMYKDEYMKKNRRIYNH
jgi:hypothetical protein